MFSKVLCAGLALIGAAGFGVGANATSVVSCKNTSGNPVVEYAIKTTGTNRLVSVIVFTETGIPGPVGAGRVLFDMSSVAQFKFRPSEVYVLVDDYAFGNPGVDNPTLEVAAVAVRANRYRGLVRKFDAAGAPVRPSIPVTCTVTVL